MRTSHLLPPVAVAGVLLLTACGTRTADGPAAGRACSSPSPVTGAQEAKDGVRITALTDVRCGSLGVTYEVTNRAGAPMTYTVTIGLMSASGGALDNVTQTISRVPPGATVRRTAGPGSAVGEVTGAEIVKVRAVPSAEDASQGGPCPSSGVRVYADQGDAAMGLRVVGLHLENCGTGVYRLDGYPLLQLLDEEHRQVDGVRVLHGGDQIASGTGADGTPAPLALKPGERAVAVMTWRNTTGFGEAVNAPYVRVRAKAGVAPVTVIPELDLGTTGKLGVGPWKRDAA
ncbi:hypothetical protein C3489_24745 [Streptomyces sp. Ru71]|uniref:DUF4232 domain-containing protein n=1 Tax=Streptomyces sp. Ru71 TaxID=2080746 RepID=UPI000CDDCCFC|nr:DUF4232 domain-containing protein [Streptomyces sp. Ru71]POX49406.1 hypothetical protein C3489_24745 [Streptomyces sp. Ru71]